MTTQTVSLSLSRLHKVNERLKALIAEKTKSLTGAQSPVQVALNSALVALPRLHWLGENAVKVAAEIQELWLVLTTLRQKVSSSNEHLGISNLLAQQESLKQALALKRSLLPASMAATLGEVEAQMREYQANSVKETYPESVDVCIFSNATKLELASQVRSLQAEIYAMSDTVARLNATIVQVELPTELAEQLGLC